MNPDLKEKPTIRDYLLGQATPDDSSRLEEQLLTDATLFQELLIVEDELIDQYLRNELAPTERQSLETHFLVAPERQGKLRFARSLRRYVDFAKTESQESSSANLVDEESVVLKPPPKRGLFWFLPFSNPIVSYSLAAALLLSVGGVSWVAFNNSRNQPSQQPGIVYAVILTPGLTRDSGEIRKFTIPPASGTIRLQLALPDNQYQSYKAVLHDSNGDIVLTMSNLKAQSANGQSALLVDLIPNVIPPGDYRITLSGLTANGNSESVGSYSFRVLSK